MQKAIEIQSNGLTLRGMLHIPSGAIEKTPIVCIFHGFTGNKMEPHFIFVKLSRMLESVGIASVRFDFGGSGESDGDFKDMTISKELEDAKNILDYVKSLDFVDQRKIGVVGLSMGGAVASMLAGDRKEDIMSLCLWAPAGDMKELILQTQTEEHIKSMKENGYADIGGLLLGKEFMEDIMKINIYGKAAKFDKNILLLHGDKDATVPMISSEKYLETYETRGALHVVKDGDHTFNTKVCEDEVLDYTIGFLEGELK
ncbi:MAG: alpha/beta hydrolase [Clostridiaceae bacterium]|nr:alpha/beta hydrolase [Clostridiaceae bacterium]